MLRTAADIARRTGAAYVEDRISAQGAALAYYGIFSTAPLLLIAVSLTILLLGRSAGPDVYAAIADHVGPKAATAVESMARAAAAQPRQGLIPTALGVLTLALGAMGVFFQLKAALNVIWRMEADPRAGFWRPLLRDLLGLSVMSLVSVLLLLSLAVSAAIPAAGTLFRDAIPGGEAIWRGLDLCVSLAVFSAAFAAVFKVLPDAALSWRQALFGGAVNAVLFVAGKQLLGLYLGRRGVSSAYGAAGSVVVLLLWFYYSSQIFLFGAELARVIITRHGAWPGPKRWARPHRR